MSPVQALVFFFGSLSAMISGIALLKTMPPKALWWGRPLHRIVALVMFWVVFIYFLVLVGVLTPATYAKFAYPVSVLILSPGWVIWLTQAKTRRLIGA